MVEITQSSLSLGIIHSYQFTFNFMFTFNVNSKNSELDVDFLTNVLFIRHGF
jgi:hypothetical protein